MVILCEIIQLYTKNNIQNLIYKHRIVYNIIINSKILLKPFLE